MTLYMVWKGYQDEGIYFATCDDGVNWSDQVPIPGIGTARGPAILPAPHGTIWMAWRGADGDEQVWWTRLDSAQVGSGPYPQFQLPNAYTSDSPYLLYYRDQVWCFFKGREGDNSIWRANASIASNDLLAWNQPHNDGLDLNMTDKSPRLTAGNSGTLYLAGKNAINQNVFVTWSADGENWLPYGSSGEAVNLVEVPAALTSTAPTIVDTTMFSSDPDNLTLVFKGMDGDDGMWICGSSDAARTWSQPQKIENVGTAEKPWLLAGGQDQLTLAWTGVDHDPNIYWGRYDGTRAYWYDPNTNGPLEPGQRQIPNRGTSHGPSVASV